MSTQPGVLYNFPWKSLGAAKYVVLAPVLSRAIQEINAGKDYFCFHILLLNLVRIATLRVWENVTRMPFVVRGNAIQKKGISFEQVDREEHWDDMLVMASLILYACREYLPNFSNFPAFNAAGLAIIALTHIGLSESFYYWLHRALHHSFLFTRYHSHHHAAVTTEAISGFALPFAECLMSIPAFAMPIGAAYYTGTLSLTGLYLYFFTTDCLNALAHCNIEIIPRFLFKSLPFLKYFIMTSSYHSLHHSNVQTNYCLFMPIYDYLGGTWDPQTDSTFEEASQPRKANVDFVFLVHGLTVFSVLHLPYVWPAYAKDPFALEWYAIPFFPFLLLFFACGYFISRVVVSYTYVLRGLNIQVWCMPRLGFNYFLPCDQPAINHMIERAIIQADQQGIKVFTLGALNKNEALNRGGALFIENHPNLKIRVAHGNTLTAAVLLHELPEGCKQVFMSGATSKLGRAVSIYLARKGVEVLMLTNSESRFKKIQDELPEDKKHFLVRVEDASAARHCKVWIAGKWLSRREQSFAPAGTHFHQFVVPPVTEYRKDCTYGKISQINVPKDTKNMHSCMLMLPRGSVFACFAGGLVHMLEGWTHHEVGPIDVDRIDMTWEAAMRHGFTPVV